LKNYFWEFVSTKKILFGDKSSEKLTHLLTDLKVKNILLVTDPGIKKVGIEKKIENILIKNKNKVIIYDEVQSEPSIESVLNCFKFANNNNEVEAVIGLGGGSSIDMAKIISLLLTYGGHPLDYYEGKKDIPGPTIPVIAVPTTAGTGSEVTPVSVLTDEKEGIKKGVSNNNLKPYAAILDPELTIDLPSYITACSGIDALSHAIESYTAKPSEYINSEGGFSFQGSFSVTDMFAIESIKLISKNLVLAVQQGNNLKARSNMLLGSLFAGISFSNAGNAAAHALAYPIGSRSNSPHGEITGLLLPYVMRFNTNVTQEKMSNMKNIFAINGQNLTRDGTNLSPDNFVLELLKAINLPFRLSQIGIKKEDLTKIAEEGIGIERLMRNNPRTANVDNIKKLLLDAY